MTCHLGDCRDVMRDMDADSVDAIVTDPPYGLSFMGKDWDHGIPGVPFWTAALRVAKPGAHLLAFGGTRTFHRLVCAIEDAGWEIRDTVLWLYGSGFPKSLDVSKAIDKAAGAVREVIGAGQWNGVKGSNEKQSDCLIRPGGKHSETAPATAAARQWDGWGTALKPAVEMICLARKPLIGTVAQNVLAHGTGAINIDGCRIDGEPTHGSGASMKSMFVMKAVRVGVPNVTNTQGRWPANVIHDGSEEVLAAFPETTSGTLTPDMNVKASSGWSGHSRADRVKSIFHANTGSAARFFYTSKASQDDRNFGLGNGNRSGHPTVKPTDLMRYLCRLVTPPGGLVLDPFMGSGSTGKAAKLEGFRFIGIEQDETYLEIARNRIHHTQAQERMFA